VIRLRRVVKRFRDGEDALTVLDGVDLDVAGGELVAVLGASGSGKSTLLYIAGGLDADWEGEATVAGRDLASLDPAARAAFRGEAVGFVFQSFNLLPSLSAVENVRLPAWFRRGGDAGGDGLAAARAALARVGLDGKTAKRPSQLSGGERQRVAIARALFASPRVLLADEPTGNLDAATGADVIRLFQELARQGMAVLIATHEERVSQVASRVLHLADGRLSS
jgi:putative ABC transport system ATP-binding protein